MRILFIARYRDDTMRRKVAHLARLPGLTVRAIEPAHWRDDLLNVRATGALPYPRLALPMWGQASDPHRATYRTVHFGLPQFQPDVIHAEEEPDSLAALQLALARALFAPRAKLVLHTWQNIHRRRAPHVEAVLAATLRAADAVLCANTDAQAILRQRGYTRPTPLIPAVGVDTEVFAPAPRPAHPGLVLGFLGRLTPEKGLVTLFTALAGLPPEITLRVVGDGPQKADLLALAAQLNLQARMTFVPPRPPADLPAEYAQLDALVLPSLTTPVWKEQLGRVLLEAMACRVPVIGSSSGAIPEVIGEAGLIFPEGDAPALAAHIAELHRSPTRHAELAEHGYQRAHTHYSQARLAERTAAFYTTLIHP